MEFFTKQRRRSRYDNIFYIPMFRLNSQFNDILALSLSLSLSRVDLAFKYYGSTELDIIFPRGFRHKLTQCYGTSFLSARERRRERLLPHKTKPNNARAKAHYRGGCRGFRCTIREPERATSIFSTVRERDGEKANELRVGNRKHCR